MNDATLLIIVVVIFIAGPLWLIYKMEKRRAEKDTLFTEEATRGMKTFAIMLGILFAGMSTMEFISSQTIHLLFPIITAALISYELGAGQLLSKLQGQEENSHPSAESSKNKEAAIGSLSHDETKAFSQNKLREFVLTRGIGLILTLKLTISVSLDNNICRTNSIGRG